MSASVKVPTALIIKNAEGQLKKLLERKANRNAIQRDNRTAKRAAIKAAVEKCLKGNCRSARLEQKYTGGKYQDVVQIPLGVNLKKVPNWTWHDEQAIQQINEDLTLLRVTSQTDITVRSGSNFARYI